MFLCAIFIRGIFIPYVLTTAYNIVYFDYNKLLYIKFLLYNFFCIGYINKLTI